MLSKKFGGYYRRNSTRKIPTIFRKTFCRWRRFIRPQWQKVALARAYMRETQLLISHRFSTVRIADRILFLEHGQLLELGSHEELLAQKGKYAELFFLQAQGYVYKRKKLP